MKTSNPHYLPYLDGWRGLAILLLLIGHFFPVPGMNVSAAGVNLFFVLSGLLMGRLLFVQQVPLRTFYRRRIARILPAVLVFLLLMTLFHAATGRPINWSEVAAAGLFVNNYFGGEPTAAVMPFGHIWSLSVEEHSYIALSLLALAVRAGRVGARLAIGAAVALTVAAGLHYTFTYTGQHFEFERWMRSEVAAFGILVSALILVQLSLLRARPLSLLAVPALGALALATHWWSVPLSVRSFVGITMLALAVNVLHLSPPLLQRLLSLAPLRQLGLWSFSVYLWQQPFYLMVHRAGLSPWLGVLLSLLAGLASYYLVERPARSYLNHRWGATAGRAPAPLAVQDGPRPG